LRKYKGVIVSYLVMKENAPAAIALLPLRKSEFKTWEGSAPARLQRWAKALGFEAKPGQSLALPDEEGNISGYLFGMQEDGWLFQLAAVWRDLPCRAVCAVMQLDPGAGSPGEPGLGPGCLPL
jgi:hypothetical protein